MLDFIQSVARFIQQRMAAMPLLVLLAFVASVPVHAGDAGAKTADFNIGELQLADALSQFGAQSGLQVVYSPDVASGLESKPLSGRLTADAALRQLLAGTGVTWSYVNGDTVVLKRAEKKESVSAEQEAQPTENRTSQEPSETLEEIVVTAQKREERLIDVPMTVVALGAEELAERGINSFQDLAFAVPELATFDNGFGGNQLFLRGIAGAGGTEPLVGVYLDEIAVSGTATSPLDLQPLDLERVEVLYGPQGTLYGQGSAGGTVRFITHRPEFGDASLQTTLDASFTEDGSTNAKVTGVANLPVVDQVFALRIVGTYEDEGGWVDAPQSGKEDINGGELYNVRLTGLWKATDAITLTPMVVIHRQHIDTVGNGEDANGDKVILAPISPTTLPDMQNDYELYGLTGTVDLGQIELLSATSYYNNDLEGAFTNELFGGSRLLDQHEERTSFNQEIRLSSKGPGRLDWTLGAFYADVNYEQELVFTNAFGSFPQTTIDDGTSWSFFGNTNYRLTEKLEVGAGARYFQGDKTNGIRTADFHSFDPRVYLSYAFADNVKTFLSAAKGFRSGGFNIINPDFPPRYEPEKVYSYELGAKFSALQSRLRSELSVYFSDYDNMQVDILTVAFLGYASNTGKARIKGVDASFQYDVAHRTTLGASGTWTDTEVTEVVLAPNDVSGGIAEGDQLNYVPKYTYGMFVEQKWDWAANVPGQFRVDYSERGKATFYARSIGMTNESDVIGMLNARLGARWGSVRLDLYGQNLLNDRDRIIPNIVNFAPRARPRTIGIQIGATF